MNRELQPPFTAAAFECFRQLSECPELKNYKIYRDNSSSPCPLTLHSKVEPAGEGVMSAGRNLKQQATALGNYPQATTTIRQCSRKWILVVSAKRLAQSRQLVVSVQGWCPGLIPSKKPLLKRERSLLRKGSGGMSPLFNLMI